MASGEIAQSENTYAGDVSVVEAWELLTSDAEACLVDVRTDAEWTYVGVPDLSSLNKEIHRISWILFPDMKLNPDFLSELTVAVPGKQAKLLFLCRSGIRSASAAIAATAAGYPNCFNILGGFEGDKDKLSHRGSLTGWKVDGLSWKQG